MCHAKSNVIKMSRSCKWIKVMWIIITCRTNNTTWCAGQTKDINFKTITTYNKHALVWLKVYTETTIIMRLKKSQVLFLCKRSMHSCSETFSSSFWSLQCFVRWEDEKEKAKERGVQDMQKRVSLGLMWTRADFELVREPHF